MEVSWSNGSYTIPTTKFGRYFGNQQCNKTTGPAVFLAGNDKLCGPPFENDYSNTIVIVYDMVYPVGEIEVDGSMIDFGNVGCSKEAMYEKLATSGALAAVTMSIDPLPSTGEFIHGSQDHDPELYSRIPLIAMQITEIYDILDLMYSGEIIYLSVTCDEPNLMLPYLLGISASVLIFGIGDFVLGVVALYFALQTEARPWCCLKVAQQVREHARTRTLINQTKASRTSDDNLRFSSQHDDDHHSNNCATGGRIIRSTTMHTALSRPTHTQYSSPAPRKNRKRGVYGQGQIMLIFGIVNCISGFFGILGIQGSIVHSFLIDDANLSYSMKSFFGSSLAGMKMFCVSLVAMFWFEMARAMQDLRPVKNIFLKHPIVIIACAIGTVLPDLVVSIIGATYQQINADAITWLYSCSTLVVALAFIFSARRVIQQLQTHISRIAKSAARDSPPSGLRRFAMHMAKWLYVFAFFSFVNTILICVFLGGRLVFRSPEAYVLGVVLVSFTSFMGQLSQILGLRGPAKRSTGGSSSTENQQNPSRTLHGDCRTSPIPTTAATAPTEGPETKHTSYVVDSASIFEDVDLEASDVAASASSAA